MRYSLEAVPYTEEGIIGSGSFANVYKVRRNDQVFALKRFHSYQLQDSQHYEATVRQIQIMQKLDHPNILKLYDVFRNDNNLELLLEYIPNGNLYQKLKEYERLPQYIAKVYLKEVLQAIKYLHSFPKPILHRDIKPENILIDAHNHVKLCDFGASNWLLPDHQRNSYVGSPLYMAPEVKESLTHNQSIDLWCFGILVYELLIGEPPENQQLIFPPYISKPAQDLIRRILIKNPQNRLNLQQIEKHIWFYDNLDSINLSRFSLKDKQQSQSEFLQRIRRKNLQAGQKLRNRKKIAKNEEDENFGKTDSQLSMTSLASTNTKYSKERQQIISEYMQKIQKVAKLRQELKTNEIKLKMMEKQQEQLKNFENEELKMITQDIEGYRETIWKLKQICTKPSFQVVEVLQEILESLDEVKKYVAKIPQKYRQKILNFTEIVVENMKIPDSEYLPKLKLKMLETRRDALIQLKIHILRQRQMPQIAMIQDDCISNTAELSQKSEYQLMKQERM